MELEWLRQMAQGVVSAGGRAKSAGVIIMMGWRAVEIEDVARGNDS